MSKQERVLPNKSKPPNERSYVRHILSALLVLFVALAWYRFGFSPGAGETSVRLAPAGTRNQVYYGPSNSIAVLPFTCQRFESEVDAGVDGGIAES